MHLDYVGAGSVIRFSRRRSQERAITMEIWSGGQTGVDRAALDVAMEFGFPIGGWIPRGRLAEDGQVPTRYAALRETDTDDYSDRTFHNVRDTDATLILRWGPATGGTLETIGFAERLHRPMYAVDLSAAPAHEGALAIRAWLGRIGEIERLNVAGPRASTAPEAYDRARRVLSQVMIPIAKQEGRLDNMGVDVAIATEAEAGRSALAGRRSVRWTSRATSFRDALREVKGRVKDIARAATQQRTGVEKVDESDRTFDEIMSEIDMETEQLAGRLEQEAAEKIRHAARTDGDRHRLHDILSAMQQDVDDLTAHAEQVAKDARAWMDRAESAVRANDDSAAKEYLDRYQEAFVVAESLQADAEAARDALASLRDKLRGAGAE